MARRQEPSVDRPTLEYLEHLGPHRVAVGDLSAAGMHGVVYGPVSGRGLPAVALGHGWLQPVHRYANTMRYLASWGIVVVAPQTERGPLPSHAGMARDLSVALRLVAGGKLAGGVISVDGRKVGVLGHSIGGGAAVLAAATDPAVKAVVTVTAAETRPSAVAAAGNVLAPGLAPGRRGRRDGGRGRRPDRPVVGGPGPAAPRPQGAASRAGRGTALDYGTDRQRRREAHPAGHRVLATAFFLRHLADRTSWRTNSRPRWPAPSCRADRRPRLDA